MARPKFQSKTKAYAQFSNLLWRTKSLVDLGTVGIDRELQEKIDPLLAKFAEVKGIRGRKPKKYEPTVKSTKGEGEKISMELDPRSAHLVKRALESHRKRHDDLRYLHYASLAVSLWASFETYNVTLFEQLYRERPELLKSSEQVQVKDAVEHRDSILDFLIERQLEAIGHLKLKDVIEYYKKRLGIEISATRAAKLEKYYFLRNVVAHKTGLVRPIQKLKAQQDFHIVGDEIQVSKTFLLRMANVIEATVRFIEAKVIAQFYK
ncbi:MAG: hypothetical protein JNK85_29550 [Verrucomicrobiales bacterium]|nr:hypothetical protein [Verrucomicrobiales bacterium]